MTWQVLFGAGASGRLIAVSEKAGIAAKAMVSNFLFIDSFSSKRCSIEEQMRGWMSYLAKMHAIDEQVFAYEALKQYFDYFKTLTIVEFDRNDAEIYQKLKIKQNPHPIQWI